MAHVRGVFIFLIATCGMLPVLWSRPQTTNEKSSNPPNEPAATSAAALPEPRHSLEKADVEAFFDGFMTLQLERSDVAGAVVVVVKDGQELLKKGYGYSDVAKKKPVDPANTIFRLASISKLFTWISVMQLEEKGKLDIDADVNKYLDFQIAPAFGKPITLRNLMTHTGGFEEEIRDILLVDPKKAQSLRNFLIENQPRRIFPPGEISAYSNYGVGLGGYVVERLSGEPFEKYVSEHIFAPMGMTHSSFGQPATPELAAFDSEGYKDSTDKPPVGFEIFSPAPAGGISSTAADMERFGQALLNAGEFDGHRILEPKTLDTMWTRQFAASDSMPGMCMGFYQVWRNGLHFVGHNGDLIAFHSMFLVEPKEKLILFVSYNSSGSASKTRPELLSLFADRYYPYHPDLPSPTFSREELKEITGTYRPTRRSETTKMKLGELVDQGKATLDKDGLLKIEGETDLRGHVRKLRPIGKDLWQATEGQNRIQAVRDGTGRIVRVAIDFPGVQYERVPWYENKSLIFQLLGVGLATILFVFTASLVRFCRRIFFSKRPVWSAAPGTLRLTAGPRLACFAWMLVVVLTSAVAYTLQMQTMPPDHTADKYFSLINWAAGIAILFSVFAVLAGLRIWSRAEIRRITRIKFSLVAASCLFLSWFAVHWNVLGPAHRF